MATKRRPQNARVDRIVIGKQIDRLNQELSALPAGSTAATKLLRRIEEARKRQAELLATKTGPE